MLKNIKEIIIIVVIVIIFLILAIVNKIFGGEPGLLSQILAAIAKGIPIMLGAVIALALMRGVWKHPAGKVVIVLVMMAIIIISIIL